MLVPVLIQNGVTDNSAIIEPSSRLADAFLTHFAAVTGQNRSTYLGVNGIQPRSDLGGLNLSTVPKVFIECANMRNAQDAVKVTSPAWRQLAARGIAESISAFLTAA
jgi:N-acetylmuramoyl-L-alanine amidase